MLLFEGGLTLIAIAGTFCLPRLGYRFPQHGARLRAAGQKARTGRRRCRSRHVLLRLAILPFFPFLCPLFLTTSVSCSRPIPFSMADWPTPRQPCGPISKASTSPCSPPICPCTFPPQGLLLAAGKLLFGNPWFGILSASALMCAALCWMLQAWLPPAGRCWEACWRSCAWDVFSYWINTYSAGGTIAALGGALVLGALPRLTKPRASATLC